MAIEEWNEYSVEERYNQNLKEIKSETGGIQEYVPAHDRGHPTLFSMQES